MLEAATENLPFWQHFVSLSVTGPEISWPISKSRFRKAEEMELAYNRIREFANIYREFSKSRRYRITREVLSVNLLAIWRWCEQEEDERSEVPYSV